MTFYVWIIMLYLIIFIKLIDNQEILLIYSINLLGQYRNIINTLELTKLELKLIMFFSPKT